jgi:hypothetical protein
VDISGGLAEQPVNPAAENWLNSPINCRYIGEIPTPSTSAERQPASFVKTVGID